MKRCVMFILVLTALPVSAAAADKSPVQVENKEVCEAIREMVAGDTDARVVVRTAIELGHNACLAVRCGLKGGGVPERVLTGAIEAGARSEAIGRCSVDEGVDPKLVSDILTRPDLGLNVCYFEPGGTNITLDPDQRKRPSPDLFPEQIEDRRPVISPFTF